MPDPQNLSDRDLRAIAQEALPHWDLQPDRIELISRSENTVFRIDTAGGRRYALRIHRPGYHTLSELESERRWTAALNEAGVPVPTGRPTTSGRGYVTISTANVNVPFVGTEHLPSSQTTNGPVAVSAI